MSVFGTIFGGAPASPANGPRIITETQFAAALRGFEDGVILYDQNFTVFFSNPAAERIFDVPEGSLKGRKVQPADAADPQLRIFTQTMFPSLAPVMISRSESGTWPQIVDLSFSEPSKELRVTTSPLTDSEGNPAGFLKIIRDRTREVSLLKAKNDFITVASHQLKTPLTNINWALEALADDPQISDANKEAIRVALGASKLLVRIVEDLLNIAKIEEGKFGYRFEQTDLVAFLNQILNQVVPQARRAEVKVYLDAPPAEQLPKVTIDSQKLSLAVVNLLDNAIRYNVKNGEVVVKVEVLRDKPFVEVSVKDTGIGIPQEELEKLFSKFFRADNAVKFQTEGTGLGLFITKNIIQAHGGELWAGSELNRGSIFHFTLPTDPNLVPQAEVPLE